MFCDTVMALTSVAFGGGGPLQRPDPDPVSGMDRPQVLDQGIAGLVLQFLQRGGSDADGLAFRQGFQPAGPIAQQLEHDLTHPG